MSRAIFCVVACLLAQAAAGCAAFDEIPAGTCGNLVVEDGEQCDGDATCATSGPAACRFTCEPEVRSCPGALACGAEGVCVASAGTFVPYQLARRYELPADRLVVGDIDRDRRDDLIALGESVRIRFGDPSSPLLASYEKRIRPPTGPATFGELDDQPGLDVVFPTIDGVFTLVARGRQLDAVPYASVVALPGDDDRACAGPAGWASCRLGDFNGDGLEDQAGYVADRDNLEVALARTTGGPVTFIIDTLDIVTDVTTGDFDGDGFADIGFATRPTSSSADDSVQVVYGAPQPEAFVVAQVIARRGALEVSAGDIDGSGDGLDDLAVARETGSDRSVALYLGDAARDLSAPFRLEGPRAAPDVPYAVVAGEFVGGVGSGIDVMAYARNPADPQRTYFWWLRGLGTAGLEVGAIDPVENDALRFLEVQWSVADLVNDPSEGNGPDEVVGLSPDLSPCAGPALTTAVPSARFTDSDLIRSACMSVPGDGWQAERIGLVDGTSADRVVALARRDQSWWVGQAERLDDALADKLLDGVVVDVGATCGDAQIWDQLQDVGTYVSWSCEAADTTSIVAVTLPRDGTPRVESISVVPRGARHVTGDFNGDGLTDVAVRDGAELAVLLQCSTDMVGSVPGC